MELLGTKRSCSEVCNKKPTQEKEIPQKVVLSLKGRRAAQKAEGMWLMWSRAVADEVGDLWKPSALSQEHTGNQSVVSVSDAAMSPLGLRYAIINVS